MVLEGDLTRDSLPQVEIAGVGRSSRVTGKPEVTRAENVSFSPAPEPKAGRILRMAMLLNLPAVFLGGILDVVAGVLHFPTSEQSLLGFTSVFVPLIWFRVGRWLDDQFMSQNLRQSTLKSVLRISTRAFMWFLFVMMLAGLLLEHHRYAGSRNFMIVALILWTGAYLAGGLWGISKDRHGVALLSVNRQTESC